MLQYHYTCNSGINLYKAKSMAVNTNKRLAIKWIRDKAKSAYDKNDVCYICNSTKDLELHHTYALTNLFEKWAKEKGYPVNTDDEVLAVRDEFIDAHNDEIYKFVFTLCSEHHQKLHTLYGKSPSLSSAPKQNLWIEKQRIKHNGSMAEFEKLGSGETKSSTSRDTGTGRFSRFL